MKLVVITPTLGLSPWLAQTVASVATYALGALHVLVAPKEQAEVLGTRYTGVQVVADPGGGMYAAINAGLAAAGDWDAFTYINDDDYLLGGFWRVVATATRLRGDVMIYGGVLLVDQSGRRLGRVPVSRFAACNRALYAERLEPVYQHGTIISRSAVDRAGYFDESLRFCGDTDMLARMCLAGVRCEYVGGDVAAFRLRPGQLTQNRPEMNAERDLVDQRLGLRDGVAVGTRKRARAVFRLTNLPAYVERISRFGWKSFDEVVISEGQR